MAVTDEGAEDKRWQRDGPGTGPFRLEAGTDRRQRSQQVRANRTMTGERLPGFYFWPWYGGKS